MTKKVVLMPLDGKRLRYAREKAGLTQQELAKMCGIGELQIHRYEAGNNQPSADYMARIARALNVSTDYLLGLSDKERGQLTASGLTSAELEQLTADPDLIETLRLFAALPKQVQQAILSIVRSQKNESKTNESLKSD